jgi:hypothetical protein
VSNINFDIWIFWGGGYKPQVGKNFAVHWQISWDMYRTTSNFFSDINDDI